VRDSQSEIDSQDSVGTLRTPLVDHVLQKPPIFNSHFFCRCIDCWNHLPPKATEASTVHQFKKALSDIDLTAKISQDLFLVTLRSCIT
jgi:hypothetical protein